MFLKAPPPAAPASGSAATAQITAAAKAKAANRIRGQLMYMALRDLLNQVRGARDALPHLAALERALGEKGVAAIDDVPPQWLAKMASQLSSLPVRADDRELGELLRRLFSALEATKAPRIEDARFLSDFHTDDRVEVNEVSHSMFTALLDPEEQGKRGPG